MIGIFKNLVRWLVIGLYRIVFWDEDVRKNKYGKLIWLKLSGICWTKIMTTGNFGMKIDYIIWPYGIYI